MRRHRDGFTLIELGEGSKSLGEKFAYFGGSSVKKPAGGASSGLQRLRKATE